MTCVECHKEKKETQFKKHSNKRLAKIYGRYNICISCQKKRKRKSTYDSHKRRYNEDELYKAKTIFRKVAYSSINRGGYSKNSRSQEILGCDFDYLKKHLEDKFQEGMSWDNYGKWHIDHIYPISKAKDFEHLLECCNYKNLQPLWAFDNISKSNKIPE